MGRQIPSGTALTAAQAKTREPVAFRQRLNRRALLQRGAALGLAVPAVAGLTALPAGATSLQAAKKGGSGTLVVSQSGDPLTFNPDFQVDDNGYVAACNIYNSLVAVDGAWEVIPELAKSWDVSQDGLTVTFHLVDNATWHDGKPLTSTDCKYTFDQIISTKSAPAATTLLAIKSVEAPDDHTVVFKLKQPSASLLGFVGWYGIFILPAHIYQGTDWTKNPANQKPVGSGPFKFVKYTPGSTIELEANMDYWGEGPYLDKLHFSIIPDANTALQSLQNGEIDVMYGPTPPLAQVPTLQKTPGLKVDLVKFPSVYYIGFNMKKDPTSKVEVRKAIAQAIDRKQILQTALSGVGEEAVTFYTSAIAWAADTNPDAAPPAFDKDAAAKALDAAGYPVKGGSRFKLDFVYFTASPQYGDIATVLKQQLKAIDIDVNLVALEIGAYTNRMKAGDFDIGLIDGFQGPDPNNLRIRVGTGGSVNYWNYSDPKIDSLLDQGDKATDKKARAEAYFAIQKTLAQVLPIVPLANASIPYPYSDKVSGLYWNEKGKEGLNRFTIVKRS